MLSAGGSGDLVSLLESSQSGAVITISDKF